MSPAPPTQATAFSVSYLCQPDPAADVSASGVTDAFRTTSINDSQK